MYTSRTPRGSRGVAAVEFAIILPLIVSVALFMVEFARAMYEYDALVRSARAAARYLTTADPSISVNRDRAVCIAKANDPIASCMNAVNPPTDPAPPPWLAPMAAATVTVLYANDANGLSNVATGYGTLNLVTVVISGYTYRSILLPVFFAQSESMLGLLTFDPISATMVRLGA